MFATTGLVAVLTTGCASPDGSTVEEERASTYAMREEALAAMYAEDPTLQAQVEKSLGYAVFNNYAVHPGLLSFASGYGVLANKAKARDTFIRWHRLTIGPGLAVKGLYAVILFDDQEAMEDFEDGKLAIGSQCELSFVFGDFGGALEHGWIYNHGANVFYVTHTGVAIELELFGMGEVTNYDFLNEAPPAPAPKP